MWLFKGELRLQTVHFLVNVNVNHSFLKSARCILGLLGDKWRTCLLVFLQHLEMKQLQSSGGKNVYKCVKDE